MSLDLGKTVLQLDQGAHGLQRSAADRQHRLTDLIEQACRVDPQTARSLTAAAASRPYLTAQVEEGLIGSFPSPHSPDDWQAVSVDGSHIDVDRHLPIPCYLVNLGGCVLTYGSRPGAEFFNDPHLSTGRDELYLFDEANPLDEEPVTGALLGIIRSIQELERLVEMLEDAPADVPTLALLDGTLTLWGLAGRVYRPFVRNALLHQRFLPALEKLRQTAQHRPVALAAYVSLPRTTEVSNAIRCCLCPYDSGRCSRSCNNRRSILPPCDAANNFLDREIFQQALGPGCRSPVYRTNPEANREYPEAQRICFYYLNTGLEIARVEVPQWVAEDPRLLSLGHGMLVQQCEKGQGYPVVISEAHEQAVINGLDRRLFQQMVIETLDRNGLPTYTSEKERSKARPWL